MTNNYIIRLDDACKQSNLENWKRIEILLDAYTIKPLVAVIPKCQDPDFASYPVDPNFWNRVSRWKEKGWIIAMHGYTHEHPMNEGGISPVNKKSEFAGVSLKDQRMMIANGISIMRKHGIDPKVFVAPLHTFDMHTIEALKQESEIRIISDTIATRPYQRWGMTFVPQQSGKVRAIPLPMVTFCYHPNIMEDADFEMLERFLQKHQHQFISFPLIPSMRKRTLLDVMLATLYFLRRRVLFG